MNETVMSNISNHIGEDKIQKTKTKQKFYFKAYIKKLIWNFKGSRMFYVRMGDLITGWLCEVELNFAESAWTRFDNNNNIFINFTYPNLYFVKDIQIVFLPP